MEFWFSEFHTPDVKHSIRVSRQLYSKQSDYQRIDIFETPDGYTVLAIEQCAGSTLLDELVLEKGRKYAIVLGNEVKGVQQEVVDMCDGCIEIPQFGTKHSLNVSVTAGIMIWEFAHKLFKLR